jgi:hypothetical protein
MESFVPRLLRFAPAPLNGQISHAVGLGEGIWASRSPRPFSWCPIRLVLIQWRVAVE